MSVGSSSGARDLFVRSAPAILRQIIGGTRGAVRIWLMREDGEKRRLQQAEGLSEGRSRMCDYSLHSIKSRPAEVGDKLTRRNFGTGTRGVSAAEGASAAACC